MTFRQPTNMEESHITRIYHTSTPVIWLFPLFLLKPTMPNPLKQLIQAGVDL